VFFCALRPTGEPLSKTELFGHIARFRAAGGGQPDSVVAGPFAALTLDAGDGSTRAAIARAGDLVGVGVARLDDRAAAMALARRPVRGDASDLEVILAALDGAGEEAVGRLVGDFAFVAWDARAHKLLAVRDALGVKPLYHRSSPGLQLFASHVGPLHVEDEFDRGFMADFLVGQPDPGTATIWRNVRAIGAGTYLRIRGTQAAMRRHWDAAAFVPDETARAADAAERFRTLFKEAVGTRLGDTSTAWAQLSGGLDSSSVVCAAQAGSHPLAGTLTYVDTLAGGDERRFSDLVVCHCGVRNEQIVDAAPWDEDGQLPPVTDEPTTLYPFWARDRETARLLRSAGADVLLSGFGADHYLTGNLHYIGDLVARGQVGTATRELAAWSVARRQSFWRMLQRHVVVPSLPAALQARFGQGMAPPAWVTDDLAGAEHLGERLRAARVPAARRGQRFQAATAGHLAAIARAVDTPAVPCPADTRYPFLYRPLVELGLRLPPRLHIRPAQRKWLLREAMRGLLPEAVRTRPGKGVIDARILWALQRHGGRLERLLHDPILAQLGCVEPERLRAAVDGARRGVPGNTVFLMSALALETWLTVRSGRWERTAIHSATAA